MSVCIKHGEMNQFIYKENNDLNERGALKDATMFSPFIDTLLPRITVHAPLSENSRFLNFFPSGICPRLNGACNFTRVRLHATLCEDDVPTYRFWSDKSSRIFII